MKRIEIIEDVKARLAAQGFNGLYSTDVRCGCGIEGLARCGECRVEVEDGASGREQEEWMNGCRAGYKHMDPRPGHDGDYVITDQKEPPEDDDEFANYYE